MANGKDNEQILYSAHTLSIQRKKAKNCSAGLTSLNY